jgi:hypothetical protein
MPRAALIRHNWVIETQHPSGDTKMTFKTFTKAALAAAAFAATATTASAWGFDICEDVTMRLNNNSGQAIEIYDLDYYDFGQSIWRSEPLPDRVIQNGGSFSFTRNLEDVENAQTMLRFRYRATNSQGRWESGYVAQSNTFTCRHNRSVTVSVR